MPAPEAATSLIKALDLLSYLTGHPEGKRLYEITEALNLPRPSVIRLLQTLVGYGLIAKEGSLYQLTERFYEWSSRDRYSALRRRYRPLIEEIAKRTGELTLVGLQEGNAIIHIDYIESDQVVRVAPAPLTRHSLRTSAIGKLALARTPHLRREVKSKRLLAELEEIDRTGVAWNRGETLRDVVALATWGLSPASTEPIIAVAWPAMRFQEKDGEKALAVIRHVLKKTA